MSNQAKLFKSNYLNVKWEMLKENLSIFILVPTLLGGIWQTVSLASISFTYIRFFSASQLISDGIFILIQLILFYLLYLLYKSRANAWDKRIVIKFSKTKNKVIIGMLSYLAIAGMLVYLLKISFPKKGTQYEFLEYVLVWTGLFWIYAISRSIETVLIIPVKHFMSSHKRKNCIKFWELPHLFFFLLGLYFIYLIISSYNKSFILPNTNYNLSAFIHRLEESNKGSNFKIEYMNDTYIFINKIDKVKRGSDNIIIYKNEILFESDIYKNLDTITKAVQQKTLN